MVEGLDEAFDRAAADDAVKAVVLTGAGKAFCVGDDLRQAWSGDRFEALITRFQGAPRGASSRRSSSQYGLTAVAVTFYLLPRLIGHSNASYMMLTGRAHPCGRRRANGAS